MGDARFFGNDAQVETCCYTRRRLSGAARVKLRETK
jgi:hypothetical protein